MSFACLVVMGESEKPFLYFYILFLCINEICLFITVYWTEEGLCLQSGDKLCLLPQYWNIKSSWLCQPKNLNKTFYSFCNPFHILLVHETICAHLFIRTHLYILVNTSYMFIIYVLHVSICVMSLYYFSFCLFRISILLDILILILDFSEWWFR